jgi:exosortase A-associated hydrolase 1
MRRWLSFHVEGAMCIGTLDEAVGTHGLLIVSGGNEVRSGAHRGMARLAAAVAAAGYPVLRFDRRGIGDSDGENRGFEASGADLKAALALFRIHCPQLTRVTAFGNCDAATTLILHDDAATGPNALLLANPWTIDAASTSNADDSPSSLPPPAAIRARYWAKLRQPREWLRLMSGGVNVCKLARGIVASRRGHATGDAQLATVLINRLAAIPNRPVRLLVAERDGTGQAFLAAWRGANAASLRAAPNVALHLCDTASHSFAEEASRAWLTERVLESLQD